MITINPMGKWNVSNELRVSCLFNFSTIAEINFSTVAENKLAEI